MRKTLQRLRFGNKIGKRSKSGTLKLYRAVEKAFFTLADANVDLLCLLFSRASQKVCVFSETKRGKEERVKL